MEEQRTKEWHDKRLGRFTSSKSSVLLSPKGILTAGAETYIYECAIESITGHHEEIQFLPASIRWGEDNEAYAKQYIENKFLGEEIREVGFLEDVYNSGASPDGIINDYTIELKCPFNLINHFKAFEMQTGEDLKKFNAKYFHQVQCQMHATNKDKGYFFTFAAQDYIEDSLKLSALVVDFDSDYWAKFENALILANERKEEIINTIYKNAIL